MGQGPPDCTVLGLLPAVGHTWKSKSLPVTWKTAPPSPCRQESSCWSQNVAMGRGVTMGGGSVGVPGVGVGVSGSAGGTSVGVRMCSAILGGKGAGVVVGVSICRIGTLVAAGVAAIAIGVTVQRKSECSPPEVPASSVGPHRFIGLSGGSILLHTAGAGVAGTGVEVTVRAGVTGIVVGVIVGVAVTGIAVGVTVGEGVARTAVGVTAGEGVGVIAGFCMKPISIV